ncbi:DNA-3-methyladenine glycosylase family protein [Dehalogenimonas etheniformans]|uniref:DNA-3-methyladenine glycosylase II n=1 Tax=Dehalogenimonas etheniformans TaxID=1536648 RepID=A0A2P5P4T4_9CHLR|nr:DNA-3-methyladenine glycosylase [Dehalogenimonas etheniformans]PPD57295.1 DNA-3-methyladenine glycosylase 2 family protein [Dehalogenimonas etheniformans]QNT77010.1 DNA-3-methyladenine glycosylase 2 family protein [Dehalogenimonas etheniformans]
MKFSIDATPPFRLDLTVWALRRRDKNIVDRWDGSRYSRTWVYDGKIILINLTQTGTEAHPKVIAELKSKSDLPPDFEKEIRQWALKVLGLNVDLGLFYKLTEFNAIIARLAREFKGVKPPRFPSIFEAMVNAIACQQVSLDAGIQILNRLCVQFGARFEENEGVLYAFPRPEDLANASEAEIKKAGFSSQKARSIKALATTIQEKTMNLNELERMPNESIVKCLMEIRGIGRWSAEYALLRGLGRLDSFPGDDVGAGNNLQRMFSLDAKPDYEQIKDLTSAWQPYQGMVYFHLLLERLRSRGLI